MATGKLARSVGKGDDTSFQRRHAVVVDTETQKRYFAKEPSRTEAAVHFALGLYSGVPIYYGERHNIRCCARTTILLEWYPAGDMIALLTSERGDAFGYEHRVDVAYQLVLILATLHGHYRVIHRDVKLDNVLVKSITPDGFADIRLGDFGLAVLYDPSKGRVACGRGTETYKSPQMHRNEVYDRRTDVWSLGVTIVNLFTGRDVPSSVPHPSPTFTFAHYKLQNELDAACAQCFDRPDCSDICAFVRTHCLVLDESKRAEASSLVDHPLFANVLPPQRYATLRRRLLLLLPRTRP